MDNAGVNVKATGTSLESGTKVEPADKPHTVLLQAVIPHHMPTTDR